MIFRNRDKWKAIVESRRLLNNRAYLVKNRTSNALGWIRRISRENATVGGMGQVRPGLRKMFQNDMTGKRVVLHWDPGDDRVVEDHDNNFIIFFVSSRYVFCAFAPRFEHVVRDGIHIHVEEIFRKQM